MKILARITARFSNLSFLTPSSDKIENATKRNPPRAKRPGAAPADDTAELNPYRCTSIVFADSACDAVKAISKKRFLMSDGNTPMLPLLDCGSSRCNCKYLHHDNRRDEDNDRRLLAALKTELYEDSGNTERRLKKRGRRKIDI